eukprot:11882442-Heterocapsa_arctica.AAC.1
MSSHPSMGAGYDEMLRGMLWSVTRGNVTTYDIATVANLARAEADAPGPAEWGGQAWRDNVPAPAPGA